MDRAILDTDILPEVMKGRNLHVVQQARRYRATVGPFTVSSITVMEIVKGLHKRGMHEALHRFVERLETTEVLAFDGDSAEVAGTVFSSLERGGQSIGIADVMIAAIAIITI